MEVAGGMQTTSYSMKIVFKDVVSILVEEKRLKIYT